MTEPVIFKAHSSHILELRFARNGRTLLSAGMDNLVKLWSVPDWKPEGTLEGHANSVNCLALTPDEKILATGSSDMTVRLWSFPDGRPLQTLQDRKKVVAAIAISPDGERVAAGSYGGRVMIWTLEGEEALGIKASQKNLTSVAFAPDGMLLATGGLGDEIALWSLPSGEPVAKLSGHEVAVGSLTFIRKGQFLSSLGYEGTVRWWDTATWEEDRVFESEEGRMRGMVFSPGEETVAVSLEGRVLVRGASDWALQREMEVSVKSIGALAFSPDGRWLLAGAADGKVRVWDLHQGV